MSQQSEWPQYYQAITGRPPRVLLSRVLALFTEEPVTGKQRQAIDLGCGDGTETLALIEQGWHVLAIDREPEAMRLVESKVPSEKRDQLQMQNASFETAQLAAADLVYAGISLPFCDQQHFPAVWRKIMDAIPKGGRFAGHFTGDKDSWASNPAMTCLSRVAVEALFDQFEIEHFEETETDRPTALGEPHHWHNFEIIARKTT